MSSFPSLPRTSTMLSSFLLFSAILLVGCDKPKRNIAVTPVSPAQAPVPPKEVPTADLVIYDTAITPQAITKMDGSPCAMNRCTFQSLPDMAPLKKVDGSALCIPPEYESQSIISAYFTEKDKLIGISCTISKEDYDAIGQQYGKAPVRKYPNQRVYEDFRTFRMKSGYITTFIEVTGQGRNHYHVYVGLAEHPIHSEHTNN